MVLHMSVELGLFEIISKVGQASASEIDPEAPTHHAVLTFHHSLSSQFSPIDGGEWWSLYFLHYFFFFRLLPLVVGYWRLNKIYEKG